MMNQGIKKMWVRALLSGRYRQTKGRLTLVKGSQKSHCCLGVLCELAVKAGAILPARFSVDAGKKSGHYGRFQDFQSLPIEVQKWAGVDSTGSFRDSEGELRELASLNDDGKKFKTLAKYIDKYF